MSYTVAAVNPNTRTFNTRNGEMISYEVRFQEIGTEVIEIAQKPSTPAPKVGDVLEGTIDRTGNYGPKFKKDFQAGGQRPFQGSQSRSKGFGGSDQFTMYLSYAKDVAVALIAKDGNLDKFGTVLEEVAEGGRFLYDNRHGAEASKPKDVAPTEAEVDATIDLGGTPINPADIPF